MSPRTRNIALIGFRGCGKTAVGRRLAELLGREHFDVDLLIERRAGRTIRSLFETDGEASFRRLETEALTDALATGGRVVSVGGGAVIAAENRAMLVQHSERVWLTADIETIAARLANDPRSVDQRPPLTDRPQREEIELLLSARMPLYAELADLTIDTARSPIEEIARRIAAWSSAGGATEANS